MRVLVACEFSGIVRDAFTARGHDTWSCDLLPSERPGQHIQGDVLTVLNDSWDLMIAHPPCTYLTCSGNKWFKAEYATRFPRRSEQRENALHFVSILLTAPIAKIALENPVGVISSRIRKPDQIIQPYYFGVSERKTTCLWLKNLSKLIPTEVVEPIIKYTKSGKGMSAYHWINQKDKWKLRSRTFLGIATAMAEQWG